MLNSMSPDECLRLTLLGAVLHGCDRMMFRSIDKQSCEAFVWNAGQAYEQIPPTLNLLQAMPTALARLEAR